MAIIALKVRHSFEACRYVGASSLPTRSTAAISARPRLSPSFRGRRHTYESRGIWRRPATPKTWPPFKTKTFPYGIAGLLIEKPDQTSYSTTARRSTPGNSLVQQDNALVTRPHCNEAYRHCVAKVTYPMPTL